ncbi:MAG: signal peptidase I [Gemmatimonadota bacterium]
MGKTTTSRRKKPSGRGRSRRRPWRALTALGLVALGAHFALLQEVDVPSRSMEDSLLAGDQLLVDKLTYGARLPWGWRLPGRRQPRVGDVVVFEYPDDAARPYVRRCAAVAAQTVEIRDKAVYVDGERLADPPFSKFLEARVLKAAESARDNLSARTVPAASIFVLGDNRDNSRDSRHFGAVPTDRVLGRAIYVYWSAEPLPRGADQSWLGWTGQRLLTLVPRTRWSRLGRQLG